MKIILFYKKMTEKLTQIKTTADEYQPLFKKKNLI